MARRSRLKSRLFVLGVLCLLILALPVLAQDGLPQPVNPSGNTIGEVAAGVPARFVVASSGNESAQIQVFGIGLGLLPRFRVLDATGTVILEVANPTLANTVGGTAFFTNTGAYVIEVSGEQGTTGQFMLSLQPGAPPPPPAPLPVGQTVEGVVGPQTPVLVYEFSTTDGTGLTLLVLGQLAQNGPAISLRDVTNDRVIATSDGSLLGVMHYLIPFARQYRLEVQSGGAGFDIPFSICLGCVGGSADTSGSSEPSGSSASSSSGACTLTTGVGGPVNVRSGPGTIYLIIGGIQVNQSFPVTGQISGGGWYQIDYNGLTGWVGSSVAALQGDCTSLPVVAAPSNAPLAPTAVPTATQTLSVTATPTDTPSATATITNTPGGPTDTPTWTATATLTDTPTWTATWTLTVAPPATTEEP